MTQFGTSVLAGFDDALPFPQDPSFQGNLPQEDTETYDQDTFVPALIITALMTTIPLANRNTTVGMRIYRLCLGVTDKSSRSLGPFEYRLNTCTR